MTTSEIINDKVFCLRDTGGLVVVTLPYDSKVAGSKPVVYQLFFCSVWVQS